MTESTINPIFSLTVKSTNTGIHYPVLECVGWTIIGPQVNDRRRALLLGDGFAKIHRMKYILREETDL